MYQLTHTPIKTSSILSGIKSLKHKNAMFFFIQNKIIFLTMMPSIFAGQGVMLSMLVSLFQFTYTTIFGMYSALLFVRTGHFAAPFIVHSYCNFMGFPDLSEVKRR